MQEFLLSLHKGFAWHKNQIASSSKEDEFAKLIDNRKKRIIIILTDIIFKLLTPYGKIYLKVPFKSYQLEAN